MGLFGNIAEENVLTLPSWSSDLDDFHWQMERMERMERVLRSRKFGFKISLPIVSNSL